MAKNAITVKFPLFLSARGARQPPGKFAMWRLSLILVVMSLILSTGADRKGELKRWASGNCPSSAIRLRRALLFGANKFGIRNADTFQIFPMNADKFKFQIDPLFSAHRPAHPIQFLWHWRPCRSRFFSGGGWSPFPAGELSQLHVHACMVKLLGDCWPTLGPIIVLLNCIEYPIA